MKQEIERKFLVTGDGWRAVAAEGLPCRQGYLTSGPSRVTVRVRLLGNQGFLTIKGPAQGISRPEFEYEIPSVEAEYLLAHLCDGGVISKVRYIVEYGGARWEVDEFFGANEGLVLAEIELEREDESYEIPDWLGLEVSLDRRYTNAGLARRPFKMW